MKKKIERKKKKGWNGSIDLNQRTKGNSFVKKTIPFFCGVIQMGISETLLQLFSAIV